MTDPFWKISAGGYFPVNTVLPFIQYMYSNTIHNSDGFSRKKSIHGYQTATSQTYLYTNLMSSTDKIHFPVNTVLPFIQYMYSNTIHNSDGFSRKKSIHGYHIWTQIWWVRPKRYIYNDMDNWNLGNANHAIYLDLGNIRFSNEKSESEGTSQSDENP